MDFCCFDFTQKCIQSVFLVLISNFKKNYGTIIQNMGFHISIPVYLYRSKRDIMKTANND